MSKMKLLCYSLLCNITIDLIVTSTIAVQMYFMYVSNTDLFSIKNIYTITNIIIIISPKIKLKKMPHPLSLLKSSVNICV